MSKSWADQMANGLKAMYGTSLRDRFNRAIAGYKLRWMLRGIGSVTTVHSDGRVERIQKTWPLGRFRTAA